MTHDEGERSPDRIAGLSLDDAVDSVVARDDTLDAEAVRRVLSTVTDDGIVREDAADEALAALSDVVSTPETRVARVETALDEAREAATPVADLDIVEHRLAEFDSRLDAVETRVEELDVAHQSLADSDAGLYATASRIHELTTAANRAAQTTDELQADIEEFERWLGDADVRYEQVSEELDALSVSLDDLDDSVDTVAEMLEAASETHFTLSADPVVSWVDLTFRHRVLELLLDDLAAELAELQRWPETDTATRAATLDERLESLRERGVELGERLTTVGPTDSYYADTLAAFEETVDAFEPPIDWNEVQLALDEHRSAVEGLE